MISGLSIGSELKRFGRGRLPRVAIVVLVLMPLLYSALYLAAFWDPFGRTSMRRMEPPPRSVASAARW